MPTKIEWCDETVNVVSGCTPISEGCRSCYSRAMIKRFAGKPGWPNNPGEVTLFPERLGVPFKWKKPKRIFVPSMSDLFHADVPDEYIAAVFGMMAATPQHTYLVLTKRPQRMLEWFEWLGGTSGVGWAALAEDSPWPLPNVHIGVSVENQKTADERIPLLIQTPAARRFISAEPLLGPILLNLATDCDRQCNEYQEAYCPGTTGKCIGQVDVDQVIVGAETGPGKRPMNLDWARSIRDQCQTAGVAYFFKKDSDGNHNLDGRIWEELA